VIRLVLAAALGAVGGAFVGGIATGVVLWIAPGPRTPVTLKAAWNRDGIVSLTFYDDREEQPDPLDETGPDAP
jgi:hypothetical protein